MQKTEKKKSSPAERIVVTGLGLLTPVGSSWQDTTAAILEGRSAYQAHETVQVVSSPSGDVLRGATISRVADDLITTEIKGIDRIEALLIPPISECLRALPEALHGFVDWEIILPDTCEWDHDILSSLTKKIPRIQRTSGKACASPNPRCTFFSQIACAGRALLKRRIEGVVMACADTLCETERLSKLMLDGRLKDPDNPYGILAGEAGGSVLLERESSARLRKTPILAAISSQGSATEPHPWPDGKPSKALGLTTAFHQAFSKLDDLGASVVHVITDENGERARALEWSLTAGRIFPNPNQERYLWHPAVVTGDTGGSLGAVVLADAIMRLILSTPPSGRITLAVSDDQGDRQVLCLEHVDQPEREEYFAKLRSTLGYRKITREKP